MVTDKIIYLFYPNQKSLLKNIIFLDLSRKEVKKMLRKILKIQKENYTKSKKFKNIEINIDFKQIK